MLRTCVAGSRLLKARFFTSPPFAPDLPPAVSPLIAWNSFTAASTLIAAISRRSKNGLPAADAGSVCDGSATGVAPVSTPPTTIRSLCV